MRKTSLAFQWITACALFLALAYGAWFSCIHVHASNKPRFVEIDSQYSGQAYFRVFHDTETGQEIVCTEDPMASCFLTGRTWK